MSDAFVSHPQNPQAPRAEANDDVAAKRIPPSVPKPVGLHNPKWIGG